MAKEDGFKEEDLSVLNQLIKSMDESKEKLEKAYDKRDHDKFNKTKKFMLEIQKKISEVLK